jgi:hypothetical protein
MFCERYFVSELHASSAFTVEDQRVIRWQTEPGVEARPLTVNGLHGVISQKIELLLALYYKPEGRGFR